MGKSLEKSFQRDQIAVIETNLDDVSGEIIGFTVDKLFVEGAKDVCIIPMYSKKNRPGQILKVMADQKDAAHLSQILIDETGTLGVRVYLCERHVTDREVHSVDIMVGGVMEHVKVKVAKNGGGEIVRVKPEYEDLKKLAEKTKKPLRELSELVTVRAHEMLLKKRDLHERREK